MVHLYGADREIGAGGISPPRVGGFTASRPFQTCRGDGADGVGNRRLFLALRKPAFPSCNDGKTGQTQGPRKAASRQLRYFPYWNTSVC